MDLIQTSTEVESDDENLEIVVNLYLAPAASVLNTQRFKNALRTSRN